eukprot:2633983-Amphidinium_carterae.2
MLVQAMYSSLSHNRMQVPTLLLQQPGSHIHASAECRCSSFLLAETSAVKLATEFRNAGVEQTVTSPIQQLARLVLSEFQCPEFQCPAALLVF